MLKKEIFFVVVSRLLMMVQEILTKCKTRNIMKN